MIAVLTSQPHVIGVIWMFSYEIVAFGRQAPPSGGAELLPWPEAARSVPGQDR
jgi:hypothetical protein